MSNFVFVESVNPYAKDERARVLLNLDAIVQFIEIEDELTVAVTHQAELESVEFICGRAKRPLSVCLPYSLAQVQEIIITSRVR